MGGEEVEKGTLQVPPCEGVKLHVYLMDLSHTHTDPVDQEVMPSS